MPPRQARHSTIRKLYLLQTTSRKDCLMMSDDDEENIPENLSKKLKQRPSLCFDGFPTNI